MLTETRKGTCIKYMRCRRDWMQGSTSPLGKEGGCSMPTPSLAKFAFCEGHCLLPSGFGWKAGDFIACFDKKEVRCHHRTSRFFHSVLPSKEWDNCFFRSKLREYYSENGTRKNSLSVKSKATIRLLLTIPESFS